MHETERRSSEIDDGGYSKVEEGGDSLIVGESRTRAGRARGEGNEE